MEVPPLNELLHTFCHIKVERGFSYGEELAFLCHRCSGIYSGFLLMFILATLTRWNGRWTERGHVYQPYFSAAFLLGICGLQVLIQQYDGDSGGGGLARFVVGIGVGLALTQGVCAQLKKKESSSRLFGYFILPILLLHTYLGSTFLFYHQWSTLPGLLALYAVINVLLLDDWFPKSEGQKKETLKKVICVGLAIGLEWLFLYYMNVGRYHV
jgi:uncharacterized membrane protein